MSYKMLVSEKEFDDKRKEYISLILQHANEKKMPQCKNCIDYLASPLGMEFIDTLVCYNMMKDSYLKNGSFPLSFSLVCDEGFIWDTAYYWI